MDEHFLATYGKWDITTFAEQLPSEVVAMLVVSVRDAPGRRAGSPRIGEVVAELWSHICAALPSAAGHRVSWGELWFLVSAPEPESIVPVVASCSGMVKADPDIEIWCAVSGPAGAPDVRLRQLDDLAVGLGKIRYRKTFPDAFCLLNGTVVNQPIATP